MMDGIRSFLCIEMNNPDILSKIEDVRREIRVSKAKIKFVEDENIHVTLKFLGNITNKMMEVIEGLMDKIQQKAFTLEVKDVGVFPTINSPKVIWIGTGEGSEEVKKIFKFFETNLSQLGFKRDKKFSSHLTIGRVKSGERRGHLVSIMRQLESKNIEFGTIKVNEILLKKSDLTPKGPIYSVLKRKVLDQG